MNYRSALIKKRAEHTAAEATLESERLAFIAAQDQETHSLEAQAIIQEVAITTQQEAHDRIAGVVSRCLETVFEDPYEFEIKFEEKRGKTEATLSFIRGDLVLCDPLGEAGGGVIDVAAFALRLACLVLERPQRRRLLCLDEPFSRIRGDKNRQRMRDLLLSLAEDFGVQFILNIDHTAFPEFLLGKVIEVGT